MCERNRYKTDIDSSGEWRVIELHKGLPVVSASCVLFLLSLAGPAWSQNIAINLWTERVSERARERGGGERENLFVIYIQSRKSYYSERERCGGGGGGGGRMVEEGEEGGRGGERKG